MDGVIKIIEKNLQENYDKDIKFIENKYMGENYIQNK